MCRKNISGLLFLLLALWSCTARKQEVLSPQPVTQNNPVSSADNITFSRSYEIAFNRLQQMLETKRYDFRQAVFEVENAWYRQKLSYREYDKSISRLVALCKAWMQANHTGNYKLADSLDVLSNYAIWSVMKDSLFMRNGTLLHIPYTYDFDDFFGQGDWTKMFVGKLLRTHSGNCHSMPYLYKILADELGASCWLALAPHHMYIKNRCKKIGWYNTELTTGQFPVDAWIKASGYISLDAIRNGLYMDTLGMQQSIALCVYDLAMGYIKQSDSIPGDFALQCCDLTLQYFPNHINTIILKAELLKEHFENKMKEKGAQQPSELFADEEAKKIYDQMEQLYVSAARLGYYEMPREMYRSWLASVEAEKEKLQDEKVNTLLNQP